MRLMKAKLWVVMVFEGGEGEIEGVKGKIEGGVGEGVMKAKSRVV